MNCARELPWPQYEALNWLAPVFPSIPTVAKVIRSRREAAASDLHGWSHWRGVATMGCRLAAATPGADTGLIVLFALLHDVERIDDDDDPQHGRRAAALVEKLGSKLGLTVKGLSLLIYACRFHNDGNKSADPTVGTCWDADRLLLPRVGIRPHSRYFSTAAASEPRFRKLGEQIASSPPTWAEALAPIRMMGAIHAL